MSHKEISSLTLRFASAYPEVLCFYMQQKVYTPKCIHVVWSTIQVTSSSLQIINSARMQGYFCYMYIVLIRNYSHLISLPHLLYYSGTPL